MRQNLVSNSSVIDLELLSLEHDEENSGPIFYLKPDEKILKSFDCNTNQYKSYSLPDLPMYSKNNGVMFSCLDKEKVFLSGGN